MIKALLDFLLQRAEVDKLELEQIESVLKDVRKKKIEYLTFSKLIKVQETKNSDGSLRIIAIASTDSVDRGNDIVIPSGIKTTNIKNGMIPMLLQHNHDMIVGGWDKWYIQDNKFVVEGNFLAPETEWQKDALSKIEAKALNGISIGFIIEKVSFDKDIRILDEIELIEVSIVTIPMNQDCYITSTEPAQKKLDSSQKTATAEEVQATTELVVSPDPNDNKIPAQSEEQNVDADIAKLKDENEQLKLKVSTLEAEVADYEAVMAESIVEIEELLKSKRSLYEK